MNQYNSWAQFCYDCNVSLRDEENYKNHLRGKPHLKLIQRMNEDKARRAMPNYDSVTGTGIGCYELPSQYKKRIDMFNRKNGDLREGLRERRRSDSDEDRHRPRSPRRDRSGSRNRGDSSSSENEESRGYGGANGHRKYEDKYHRQGSPKAGISSSFYPVISTRGKNDHYRPKLEQEITKVNGQYHCEPCDTYTLNLDVMQAHLSGKNHKKKTKQINRFACDLCLIEVSSAETLQTHYQGMSHIKRAKVAEEAKKEAEHPYSEPLGEQEELHDLRQRCRKLERQNANLQKEVEQLLKFKKNCLETHHNIKTEGLHQSDSIDTYNDRTVILH